MAKKIKTEKGFLVIKMNTVEAARIGFGIGGSGACICMECNNPCFDIIYYIAVLNDTMCAKCYNEYIKEATYYPEDSDIEQRNYDFYISALKKNGIKIEQ